MELSRIAAKRHLIRVMTFAREIIAEQEEFGSKSSNPGQDAHLNAKVESLRRQLKVSYSHYKPENIENNAKAEHPKLRHCCYCIEECLMKIWHKKCPKLLCQTLSPMI